LGHSASAILIDPTYTTFGALPQATFSGTGIPNTAVATSRFTIGNQAITLGLTATARYSAPTVANNGAGTFYAQTGVSSGTTSYARWNVDYYVNFNPGLSDFSPGSLSVRLYYDKNSDLGNDVSSYITLEPNIFNGFDFNSQDSENLGMRSVFPTGTFNPNASGEYDFALVVLSNGKEVGRSAISVVANSTGQAPVPDAGTTISLLGLSLGGLSSLKRFRQF
jgi:hypothetical protein